MFGLFGGSDVSKQEILGKLKNEVARRDSWDHIPTEMSDWLLEKTATQVMKMFPKSELRSFDARRMVSTLEQQHSNKF